MKRLCVGVHNIGDGREDVYECPNCHCKTTDPICPDCCEQIYYDD